MTAGTGRREGEKEDVMEKFSDGVAEAAPNRGHDAVPDDERCFHMRWSLCRPRCTERGFPSRRMLGNVTDQWMWCAAHDPQRDGVSHRSEAEVPS